VHSRKVIRVLQADGWEEVRRKGSHRHFQHPTKRGTVTVPHPKKDLAKGLLKSIEKQAKISLE
jgi:predicted RNA binding protein YcfA (HicA-like mRNA interferase family)